MTLSVNVIFWPLLEIVRFNFKSNINKIKYLKEQFFIIISIYQSPPKFSLNATDKNTQQVEATQTATKWSFLS